MFIIVVWIYQRLFFKLSFTAIQRAATRNVRVLLDAEQTYYQPAIRNLTLHYMMKRYNLEHPVIYDTVQSYLKVNIISGRTYVKSREKSCLSGP